MLMIELEYYREYYSHPIKDTKDYASPPHITLPLSASKLKLETPDY